MTQHLRAIAALAVAFVCLVFAGAASAQGLNQIALTEKQIQNFIAVQPAISQIMSKVQGEPDAKTKAALEAAVKKSGFANFGEYDDVASNIGMVMLGIDPQTKKFGDPKAVLQAQIAQIQADKSMKPDEKKQAIDEINNQIKALEPIKNQGNIALVVKYYDKLAGLMQQ